MTAPSDCPGTPGELTRLAALLDEATRREAEFRLASAQDFLEFEARLRTLAKTIGERDTTVHQLHLAATAREACIHELHIAAGKSRKALQDARADVETMTWMLHDAAKDPMRAAMPEIPGVEFTYHLHTSPYRIYRTDRFLLRGWGFPKDGRAVSAVRVRVDDKTFSGHYGLDEPEVIAQHGPQALNPRPGFEIEFTIPLGRHWFRLEACLENRDWVSFLSLPIWRLG